MYVSLQANSLPGSPHVDLSDVNQSTVGAIRNFAANFFLGEVSLSVLACTCV